MSSNSKVQWKRNDPTALSIPKRTPFKVLNKPDDNQLSDRTTTCLNIIPPPHFFCSVSQKTSQLA